MVSDLAIVEHTNNYDAAVKPNSEIRKVSGKRMTAAGSEAEGDGNPPAKRPKGQNHRYLSVIVLTWIQSVSQ